MSAHARTSAPLAPSAHAAGTEDLVDRAATQAGRAIDGTRRLANDALDALTDQVDQARQAAPGLVGRVAARADDVTRRGLQRAQEAREQLQDQLVRAGDASRGYIRDEPVKAVLMAAAAGAAAAALVGYLCRDRGERG